MVIWIVTGLWVLLGCAEAAHLITLITDRSLQTYTTLCGAFCLAGLLAYLIILGGWYRRQKGNRNVQIRFCFSPYMIVFAITAGLTIYHFVRGYVPDLEDAVYEIVTGNVQSGSIMTVHPFLGTETSAGMPLRMQILGLSSLYSALVTISQQSQYMILCKVVPLVVWGISLLIYSAFAEKLFFGNIHKRWAFLSLVAGMYLLTGTSEGMAGYRLLYAGFCGETIRGVLLLPYTLYVCWQRKWLLAVLAIVVEACLVWTTYGVGYAFLITVCMVILHLCLDRRGKHAT